MKKTVDEILKNFVYTLCLITGSIIAISAIYPANIGNLWYRPLNDHVVLYCAIFVVLMIVAVLIYYVISKLKKYDFITFLLIGVSFAFSIIFVFANKVEVVSDQIYVLSFTLDSLNGNFWGIFKGTYIGSFPYQLGLVALQSAILKTCSLFNKFILYNPQICIQILRLSNCIFSFVTNIYGVAIVRKFTANKKCEVIFAGLVSSFAPLYIYNSFVYNDIPSLCFAVMAIYYFMNYCHTEALKHASLFTLLISLSVVVRLNSIIIAIAFALVLLYRFMFESMKISVLMLSLLVLVFPLISMKLPIKYYEKVSDYYEIVNKDEYVLDEGCPYIATIAMGLDIDANAYGWFSGYNMYVYSDTCSIDTACAVKESKIKIRESIEQMLDNPSDALNFFAVKTVSQWGDGTLSSLHENSGDYIDLKNSNIYINCYMKAILIIVSVGSLVNAYKKGNSKEISAYILDVVILGGFLFSLFWEAKSRYNLSYYFLMLINSSLGYANFFEKTIDDRIRKSLF